MQTSEAPIYRAPGEVPVKTNLRHSEALIFRIRRRVQRGPSPVGRVRSGAADRVRERGVGNNHRVQDRRSHRAFQQKPAHGEALLNARVVRPKAFDWLLG